MLYFYQHLPQYIDPIAFTIGSFSIRWYAISYLVGFGVVYGLLKWRIKKGESSFSMPNARYQMSNILLDFLFVSFFSSLIGGRIGYVLFYNFSYFIYHPLAIISPYENGQFIGIYGMSYHGAIIGVLLGSYIFLRIKKIEFWEWADFIIPAVPLGYFFGRIGNFLNGELYGRITNSSWGMYFADSPTLLRYPSQLLEALLEGVVLFVILWKMRKIKLSPGVLFSIYLVGYGIFRIFAETFREPDPQIGFIAGYFTLGQILSLAMIISGVIIFFQKRKI